MGISQFLTVVEYTHHESFIVLLLNSRLC